MNRTLRLKLLYLATAVGLGVAAWGVVMTAFPGRELFGACVVGLVLLVPGRLQGYFFRSLFRGRRSLDRGSPTEALDHFRAFVDQLKERPWRKRLIWLAWTVYTTDVEAMTWNNVGAAHTRLGNADQAREAFERALTLDRAYALPHVNLAVAALVAGDRAEAERRLETARALGYRATSIDRLIHGMQAGLARIEGRGDRDADGDQ